ncbi:RNA methyltransferase [Segetibacter sp. 3557_3]|nr:RNA methyltransferase [Segetibacter sp. 3557_3]
MEGVPGFEKQPFVEAHQAAPITSIRLNPSKLPSPHQAEAGIINAFQQQTGQHIDVSEVPWCKNGRYLSARPSFTLDPLFHAGAYYVQEASSMFLEHALRSLYPGSKAPETALDLCAAPGGKSTLITSLFQTAFIVCNEVIKTRVSILAENMSKWGSDNVVVTHNDPKDFEQLRGFFDLVVIDAPCSGSGLFRKDPLAIEEWSEANVHMCSMRQQRILSDALPALKQDGYLVYSTCSYSVEENENICDWLIDKGGLEPVKIPFEQSWGIVETMSEIHGAPGYRFYPGRVSGEGFFMACFRQVDDNGEYASRKSAIQKPTRTMVETIAPWLMNSTELDFALQKDMLIAFPARFREQLQMAQGVLSTRKSGVAIGEIKGTDLIPHHEFALSPLLSAAVGAVDLDLQNALLYLKRKDLKDTVKGKGWMLARYQGYNLGWMKVLPNRINNYYPVNWRILKD